MTQVGGKVESGDARHEGVGTVEIQVQVARLGSLAPVQVGRVSSPGSTAEEKNALVV